MSLVSRRRFVQGCAILALHPIRTSLAVSKKINLFNQNGNKLLNSALSDPQFWAGADVVRYEGEIYDESRLKSLSDGYLTMISGEGGENFTLEHVIHTVLTHQPHLPQYMAGSKICKKLRTGVDPRTGVAFTDLYFVGDFDFFYGEYFQRMYRFDLPDGRTACAFECLKEEHLTPELWKSYNKARDEALKNFERRWYFNDLLPIIEIFGMYLVEPGEKLDTRVTLVAKLKFGGDSWLASVGTKIPFVLRLGMESGFEACVAIARGIKQGKYAIPK